MCSQEGNPPGTVRQEFIDGPPPAGVIDALAVQPNPVMLESSASDERFGRYTVIACRPVETFTLGDSLSGTQPPPSGGGYLAQAPAKAWGGTRRPPASAGGYSVLQAGHSERQPPAGAGGWSAHQHAERRERVLNNLREALGKYRVAGPPVRYGPGWIGYVAYEFGRCIERLPGRAVRDTSLPDLHLAFYDATAVYDAIERRWRLAWLEGPDGRRPPAAEALRGILTAGKSPLEGAPKVLPASPARLPAAPAESNFSPDAYRRAVARCVEYIRAGDIFQVNLSQRLTVAQAPPPTAIYRALRARNPAWYAAMLLTDAWSILSSSPELFLRVDGGDVLTRPIKGTRPRTGEAAADAAAAAELLASEKDNAELAMIIDLLRNDLGRVCRFGSVRVTEPRALETHPTVYHLVGSIVGRLREGVDVVDLLAAAFPGGSITGAPKIRAMEIIDELEPVARGVYTGAIGWIAPVSADGAPLSAELNIVIRTIVCEGGRAHVPVGGGIVADSTPEGEYQETLDKARALLEAIAAAASRPALQAPRGAKPRPRNP